MNDSGMQMTAGVPVRHGAEAAAEQAAHATPRGVADGGLDTGARGWRWLAPAARQMQASTAERRSTAKR